MPDNEICSPTNKRTPWNKGKLIGVQTTLATKARLVDQNSIAARGTNTRPLLPSIASLAAAMSWLSRSTTLLQTANRMDPSHCAAEEDGATSQVRANGSDLMRAGSFEPDTKGVVWASPEEA